MWRNLACKCTGLKLKEVMQKELFVILCVPYGFEVEVRARTSIDNVFHFVCWMIFAVNL